MSPFKLPPLPFDRNALRPHISPETLDFHYGRHHKAYVDTTNKLVAGTEFEDMSLEEIIRHAPAGPLWNNAAQAWNHDFYWKCLTPGANKPGRELLGAIEGKFGSLQALLAELTKAAAGHFGSGWAWLVQEAGGGLAVEALANAGNPLKAQKTPLLTIDVWEHAYYIDYRNERAKYLEGIQHLVNWEVAESLFTPQQRAA